MRTPRFRPSLAAALVAVVAVSAPGRARADDLPHLEAGLRSGVLLPVGEPYADGTLLSDTIAVGVPLWLDVQVALTARWSLGLYGAYAPCVPNKSNEGNSFPAPHDWRGGVDAELRGAEGAWVGFGAGFESLSMAGHSLPGIELGRIDTGYDFFEGPARLGFFATAALGEFLGADPAVPYAAHAFHGWIGLGLRVRIKLVRRAEP